MNPGAARVLTADRFRTDRPMIRPTLALALTLGFLGAAEAQTARVPPASDAVGAPGPGTGTKPPASRPTTTLPGNPSGNSVPGTNPGVWIGGSPTAGPPGSGGTAGGPAAGNR